MPKKMMNIIFNSISSEATRRKKQKQAGHMSQPVTSSGNVRASGETN